MNKLDVKTRKQVNNELYVISKIYHDSIPLDGIKKILSTYNLVLLQEDNTEWQGFICGNDGRDNLTIGYNANTEFHTPIDNSMMVLSWYKLQSGRYEINVYLS